MNIVMLVGTVSSDVRKIDLQSGASVTKMRVKTVNQYRQDGELKERSQTHLIDIWSPSLQKDVTPYLKQGQMVSIQGSLESRNMAKPGETPNWTTSVVLRGGSGMISVYGGPGSETAVHSDAASAGEVNVDHSGRRPEPVSGYDDGLGDDIPF